MISKRGFTTVSTLAASLLLLVVHGCSGESADAPDDGLGTRAGRAGQGASTSTGGTGGNGGAGNGGSAPSGGTSGSGASGGGSGNAGSPDGGGKQGAGGGVGSSGTSGSGGNLGSAGSAGSAGSSGTGGSSNVPACANGKKDGSETGVDCGGSCPACQNYKINPPRKNNDVQSGCQGGPGYMCVRSMLFSPELKQAAMDDWSSADPPFVYGTVGHDPDLGGIDSGSNTCCQCYQLVFESPIGASGLPIPKPMIVQAFNTAAGGGKKFDIYMAAGGFGANNGCIGGSSPMYDQFPDLGGNYTGGVRASRYSQCASSGRYDAASIGASTCQGHVGGQCQLIRSSASSINQSTSQQSCIQSNFVASHYHINWNVRAKRVTCPENLTRVTGCKLNNQGLPQANPAARDTSSADSSFVSGFQTTTMQDCCRPTCAWSNNVTNSDPTWSLFYTCDRAGNPATQ